MALQENKEKLTGHKRAVLMAEWLRRGKPKTYEEFVKLVCEAKGLHYTPPRKKL